VRSVLVACAPCHQCSHHNLSMASVREHVVRGRLAYVKPFIVYGQSFEERW
jgi:hypothetical protein